MNTYPGNTIVRFMKFDREDLVKYLKEKNLSPQLTKKIIFLYDESENMKLANLLIENNLAETTFHNDYEYETDELQFHYEPPELEIYLKEG